MNDQELFRKMVTEPRLRFVEQTADHVLDTLNQRSHRAIMTGVAAIEMAVRLLQTSGPLTLQTGFGPVELRPGVIWSGERILLSTDTVTTYYMIRDKIYEVSTSQFLRTEWFFAEEKAVAQADWIVTVGKAEVAFLAGVFVKWYILLGLFVVDVAILYHQQRDLIHEAFRLGPTLIEQLNSFRKTHPVLFNKLASEGGNALIDAMRPGAEDISFFLGRLLRNTGSAAVAGTLTLRFFVKWLAITAGLVTATHLPSVTGRATEDLARGIQKELAQSGLAISDGEAAQIATEILRNPSYKADAQALQITAELLLIRLVELEKHVTRLSR